MSELTHIVKQMIQDKKDVVRSIFFGFLAGITAVGLFAANGYLISQAALEPPLYVLIAMVAVVKIGSFIRALSRYAERYYSHRATFTMLSNLRVYFYEKIEQIGPALFQKHRSGDLLSRIVGDVESLQNFFLRVLYPPIVMALVFLSTMIFVSFYSMAIVLCLLVGLLLTAVIIPAWFSKRQKKASSQILEERSRLSIDVAEWFYGFRELTIHQKRKEKEQDLVSSSNRYIKEQEQAGIQSISYQSINMAVSLLVSWLVLAVGAFLVASGELNGLFLAMLVMISFIVFEQLVPMALFPIHYEESERAASRLYSVADNKQLTQARLVKQDQDLNLNEGKAPSVHLKDISFAFVGDSRNTLSDISVSFPAGSKTAIVGPSGSGKSTLLKLILKQYEAKGEIFFGTTPLKQLDQEMLWEKAKVILQENHFFYGTVKDNLLLSDPNLTEDQLQQLLIDVQLPYLKLNDLVLEKGQNLSGGEKQRLAMARALAKKGQLWLLDEPTSSLDSSTEQCLYDLFFNQAKEDTVILVSHRFVGLEKMDQIIVIDQGRLVEVGSYSKLMRSKGYFYQLKQIEDSILQ
ncbi:thiol reductant ABC exporter subunit CydC [Halalkalibacter okhensis]|uniref:ABC transporter ATP-binding protein n=1 Tax=Halalkalibacter okhensis TaxID=333138 RepID=A0A0B0IKM1_9BACI|nr:thiol reductant ABC exporter subunit CydC [Halalkalibacter okhensis]KHF41397.1 ABC transporter ATP-binding protein [Halalkalibacter okhensis]